MWKVNLTVDICLWNYRKILGVVWQKNLKDSFQWGYCNIMSKAVPRMFCKKGIQKIFAKFTRQNLCWRLFIMRLLRLHCRCFLVNLAKFQVCWTSRDCSFWNIISLLKIILNSLQKIFHNSIPWNHAEIFRSSHQRCSIKKSIVRNFAKFTGKHLC